MKITITKNEKEFDCTAAWRIIGQMLNEPESVIGLSTGRTTGNLHRLVGEIYTKYPFKVDTVTFFGLDEVTNVPREYAGACYTMLKTELMDTLGIKEENFLMLPTISGDFEQSCRDFQQEIANRGGIDLLILGLGENGHLGFNQPESPFGGEAWVTRMNVELEERIRRETGTKLTALEADENFVPLEIMQQATREEAQLAEIKEQVIEEKKQDKLITDNTQINVKTEVIPGVDANGKKILNYKVGYQYEVINKEFSAKEDFPSGGYNIERSNAAMSLMKIIKNAFEGDFAKYLSEGKQVKVIITGSADAAPIRGRLAYDGRYGEFVDEPYYKDGNLDNITVTKAGGITQNEQLALMRAAGVKTYIEKNVTTLGNTKNEYEYHVEVAKERGGEFRKINVEFVIMDAFQQ